MGDKRGISSVILTEGIPESRTYCGNLTRFRIV